MEAVTLKVNGMSCGHCVKAIEGSVGELNGVETVKVDLAAGTVAIEYKSEQVSLEKVKKTIDEEGYEIV
ncbi:copper chaperone CopZ [Sutcliffiella rhizosphaerae]|uniref:Copper chaperone CopZ n=1 Tax=Sutcliffiella rhizosphaerae TaxID=2880967 RepID=A0ABM8YPV5_9BACI|nr:copper chaperone CopZ [Sutcliffiella rhizosphaerae]CAG9622044.1 Copper chaperone CopZ [Sutcliffiella rhizosphaerae]